MEVNRNNYNKVKKDFAREFLKGYKPLGTEKTAIFMAGLPGVGKTEFSNRLTGYYEGKIARIDMDEIAANFSDYRPEKADEFRGGATTLLEKIFDIAIDKEISFILDGTFGGSKAIRNIERVLKRGYNVNIYLLVQNPLVAWSNTLEREKVEHRAISKSGFIESCRGLVANLRNLFENGYDKLVVDVIVKNKDNGFADWLHDINLEQFDNIAKEYYNMNNLREYLNVG